MNRDRQLLGIANWRKTAQSGTIRKIGRCLAVKKESITIFRYLKDVYYEK